MKVAILTASAMKKTINGEVFSGKCITGLDLDSNRIVRFVRNSFGAPVENPYCNRIKPLGVYDVELIERCPLECQTENVIVDYHNANYLGEFEGGIDTLYKQYQKVEFKDRSFLLDGSNKLTDISPFMHSLEIIKASNINIHIGIDEKKTIASFRYCDKEFRFVSVTDPDYRGIEQIIEEAYLVISIPTDDFDGHGYFKFIAAIFPIEKAPWSREEDEDLAYEYKKGWPMELMMASHKRKEEEIRDIQGDKSEKKPTAYPTIKPQILRVAEEKKVSQYMKSEPVEIPELHVGDKIMHKYFGEGKVISVRDNKFSVQFAEGIKTLSQKIAFTNGIVTMIGGE